MNLVIVVRDWIVDRPDTALLCLSTIVGLFLVPAGLGPWIWLPVAAFAGLNFFLFLSPEYLFPRENPWICIALSVIPWVLFCLDLAMRGRASRVVAQTSLRSWIAWPLFRVMGVGGLYAAYAGALPADFAVTTVSADGLTALGAVVLWLLYRPQNKWYRTAVLFWCAYGLVSSLAFDWRWLTANPHFNLASASFDIRDYFTEFPNAWIPFFWVPMSILIHGTIFFKLYTEEIPP